MEMLFFIFGKQQEVFHSCFQSRFLLQQKQKKLLVSASIRFI